MGIHELARQKYRLHAPWYDSVAAPLLGASYQREAVSLLHLGAGDVVVDVACGTGINFPLIEQGIAHTGHLIGVDVSPEMLREAHIRVVSHGWTNVTLINAPAEEAQIHQTVDAFLFSFAHDVLQSPRALRNLFQHARRGARVAACGIKWAPWWSFPSNLFVFQIAQQYHVVHEGLSKPWGHLTAFVSNLEIRLMAFETIYMACGTVTGGVNNRVRD